ncbi:MAG: hypothetical protein RL367_1824 [Pseudomonadota bacterium]|jgi:cytochrome c5
MVPLRIVMILLAGAAMAAAVKPAKPVKLPKGPGQALVQAKCGGCHQLSVVAGKRQDADHWAATVDQMISRGAKVPDADYDVVVDYLAKNFGVKR